MKQSYWSYSRTQNSKWFSIISVINCEVNIVAEYVHARRMTIKSALFKQTVLNSWYVKTTRVRRGLKMGIRPLPESGTKNQNFLNNLTSAVQFWLIDLFLSMTVYLPLWHLHCTRAGFTVLVWCSCELAVHSCLLLCLQVQVAKLTSGLFYRWSLLCNNNMAINLLMFTSSYDFGRFAACVCRTQASWQVLQWDSDCWKR